MILAERVRTPFDFREIDIERDDKLVRDYGVRIPVVEIDGDERFELSVDPAMFAAELGHAAHS